MSGRVMTAAKLTDGTGCQANRQIIYTCEKIRMQNVFIEYLLEILCV